MKKAILSVLLIGAWSCCSAKGTDAATPKPVDPPTAQVARAPLSVTLEGRPDKEGVQLLATVEVQGRLAAPLDFALEWDGEAKLVQGTQVEVVDWKGAPGTLQKSFSLVGTPTEVRITVSSIGQSMGATAKAAWPPAPPARSPPWR